MAASLASALIVSGFIAGLGIWRRWLTIAGALAAVPVGICITCAGWDTSALLFSFFVTGSLATKINARILRNRHRAATAAATTTTTSTTSSGNEGGNNTRFNQNKEEEKKKGLELLPPTPDSDAKVGRGALQVLATAGIPALMCAYQWPVGRWRECVLAYFACCCGDTLASEFGSLSRTRPRLVTSFRLAKTGRDGAMSPLGTLASAAGGALIGAVGAAAASALTSTSTSTSKFASSSLLPSTSAAVAMHDLTVGLFAGWAGSVIDSFLGALLQSPDSDGAVGKPSWKLYNCAVNASSSCLTVLLVLGIESSGGIGAQIAAIIITAYLIFATFGACGLLGSATWWSRVWPAHL